MTHVVPFKIIIPWNRLTVLPSTQKSMRLSFIVGSIEGSIHLIGIGDAVWTMRPETERGHGGSTQGRK